MEKSRRMIYPHTLTAKLLQFPFKHYFNNNPFFFGWVVASVALIPLMYKIQKALFAPVNVAKAEARKKKDHEEYLEHLKHQL